MTQGNQAENDGGSTSRLARIMTATSEKMKQEFAEAKAGFEHNTIKGDAAESIVRNFLDSRLPSSVGATSGQVVDSEGNISRQVDVILYDSLHTPMLLESPSGDHDLVPAEGVLAVVEVKTHLDKAELEGILKNCRSVKTLSRSAYFDQPFQVHYRKYGTEWVDLPVFYTVFAGSSDNLYAGPLNELQEALPLHERIDTVCCLDRGVNLNAAVNSIHSEPIISATSSPGSGLLDIGTPNALLLWYGTLASEVLQAGTRPIDIGAYMRNEVHVAGTMPQGPITEAMRTRLVMQAAEDSGLDPGILERLQTGGLTPEDMYYLLRSPNFGFREDATTEQRAGIEVARQAAVSMTLSEWLTAWQTGLIQSTTDQGKGDTGGS